MHNNINKQIQEYYRTLTILQNASFPRMSHTIEHAGETRVAASGNNRRPATNNRQRNKKGAASYSPALHRSTIGAGGLNFSVRDGKRWDTAAIATRKGVDLHDKQGPVQRPLRTKARRKTTIAQRRQNVAAQGNRSGESVRAISSARLWRRRLYTCALSTSSSRTTLKGALISRQASRLDAFSAYPNQTRIPGGAPGGTTGKPEVCPARSSRTSARTAQDSNAHDR